MNILLQILHWSTAHVALLAYSGLIIWVLFLRHRVSNLGADLSNANTRNKHLTEELTITKAAFEQQAPDEYAEFVEEQEEKAAEELAHFESFMAELRSNRETAEDHDAEKPARTAKRRHDSYSVETWGKGAVTWMRVSAANYSNPGGAIELADSYASNHPGSAVRVVDQNGNNIYSA